MKIIFVAPSFYPAAGGVETHLRHVVKILTGRGHKLVILVRYAPQIPRRQTVDGAVVLRLPRRLKTLWLWTHRRELARPDAIHFHDLYLPALKKLYPTARLVQTFHGYEGFPVQPEAIKVRQWIRSQVPYCIAVGAFIEKWYGTKCEAVIYGGVENPPPAIAKIQPAYAAVFVGRLEPDTGFKTYLEAWELINKQDAKAKLLVVGDGSLNGWAQDFVRRHQLQVEFKGRVDSVWESLAAGKVAFVSGYLAILEAGVLGKPIVAFYDTPIKKDYLECHPMAANFAIADSVAAIAAAYAKPPNSSQQKALQAWAKQQTWDKIANLYEQAYGKI